MLVLSPVIRNSFENTRAPEDGRCLRSLLIFAIALVLMQVLQDVCLAEVKIAGVPNYQQGDFAGSNDCAPVASANVLGYWDANGFPNLIDGSNDYSTNPTGVTALVDLLKTNMHWTSSGTQISWIWLGITITASQRGYSFSTHNDGSVLWDDITTEITAGRPPVFTMFHVNYGAMHSVAVIGFDDSTGTRIAIVHDEWHPAADVNLNFDETTDRTLTTIAPPAASVYTLTTQSSPITSVSITVSPSDNSAQSNGSTNFTRTYNSGTSVSLTAPAAAASGQVDYTFVRWTLDGADQTAGQTSLSVTMSAAHTVVAVYQIQIRTLTVQSSPITGIAITGDKPGTTNYAATCDDEQVVNLAAPATAASGNVDYTFVRWTLDGANQTAGQASVQVTMSAAHTVVAVYQIVQHTLTVESAPGVGVEIAGDKPGTASYSAACDDEQAVSLTAPRDASFVSEDYTFVRWMLDGANQTDGEVVVHVAMSGNHTLVAVYEAAPPSTILDLSATLSDGEAPKLSVADGTSSGDLYGTYVPSKAFDGNTTTFWSCNGTPTAQAAYLIADLRSAQTVSKVRLLPRAGFPSLFPANFTIDVSTDGETWTQAGSQTGYTANTGTWYERTLLNASARYVRLSAPATSRYAGNGLYYTQIAEFEIHGEIPQVVNLAWTAPGIGNGGATGTATSYTTRYSSQEITTEIIWNVATLASPPAPQVAGTAQSMTVSTSVLPIETRIYFAIRALNSAGTKADLSNSPYVDTPEMAPAAVTDLAVESSTITSLTIGFTAVGDNALAGQATSYDIRISTSQITDANWSQAAAATGIPAPATAGTAEAITITGLQEDTTYYVALKVLDDLGDESDLSNVVTGATLDATPPAAITDLQAALSAKLGVAAVTSSSYLYGTTIPSLAADGNASTFWGSSASPAPAAEHLTLDLGATEPVEKVRLLPRTNHPELFPTAFTIQVSTDGSNWIQVASENAYAPQSGVWYEKSFHARNARYVRLAIPATRPYANGYYYAQIAEFEAHNTHLVQLNWTAPGDNASTGTAASYEVRYSTSAITDSAAWSTATAIPGQPSPQAAGAHETMLVNIDDLPASTRVYLAMKTKDEVPNTSATSNSPYVNTPTDDQPPGPITDLAAILVDVTSPPELPVPSASSSSALYGRFVADNAIDGDTATFWSSADSAAPTAETLTLDLGSVQTVGKVRSLPGYFASLFPSSFQIRLSSDGTTWSDAVTETGYTAQSGVWYEKKFSSQNARYVQLAITATKLYSPNGLCYAEIGEFEAYPSAQQAVQLTWTAPGDSGYVGTAASYEVRWSTTEMADEVKWNAATIVSTPPAPQAGGTSQSMIVGLGTLPAGTRTYFAVRARDEGGSQAGLPSSASADTPSN